MARARWETVGLLRRWLCSWSAFAGIPGNDPEDSAAGLYGRLFGSNFWLRSLATVVNSCSSSLLPVLEHARKVHDSNVLSSLEALFHVDVKVYTAFDQLVTSIRNLTALPRPDMALLYRINNTEELLANIFLPNQ